MIEVTAIVAAWLTKAALLTLMLYGLSRFADWLFGRR